MAMINRPASGLRDGGAEERGERMNIEERKGKAKIISTLLEEDILAHVDHVGYLRIVRQFIENQRDKTGHPMFLIAANALSRLILEIDLHTLMGGSIFRNIPNEQNLQEN